MKFINLHDQDGYIIYVSVENITAVWPGSDYQGVINSTISFNGGPSHSFREDPATIMKLVGYFDE